MCSPGRTEKSERSIIPLALKFCNSAYPNMSERHFSIITTAERW
jgi:hypothetical protein